MCRYCSDHYGSVLWDVNNPSVEDVCITWRKGLERSYYDLPRCTHSLFVPAICELLPLKCELARRQTCSIGNCLNSVNSVVEFVARNGVYFSRMYFPIGRSAQFCYVHFEVHLRDLGGVNQRLAWQLYNRDMCCHNDDINVLAVKHGNLELDLFSNSVLDAFIEFLCTNYVYRVLIYVYSCTIFIK